MTQAPLASAPLLAADILLTRDRGRISRLIRAGEILRSDDGTAELSHAELVDPPSVIGSMWRVREAPLTIYDDAEVVVWRHRGLTDLTRGRIVGAARTQLRSHYGVFKLCLFALDAVFGTTCFTRRLGLTNFKVCSQYVAWGYWIATGYFFGRPWREVSPDDIDDWCLAHPEEWEEVYCSLRYRHAPKRHILRFPALLAVLLTLCLAIGCASFRPPDSTRIPPMSVPGPAAAPAAGPDTAIRTTQPPVPAPGPAGPQGPAGPPGRDIDLATLRKLEKDLADLKRAQAADQAGSSVGAIGTMIPGGVGLGAGLLALVFQGLGSYRRRQIEAKQKQIDQLRADLGLPAPDGPPQPPPGDPIPPQGGSGTAPAQRMAGDLLRLGLTQLSPEQLAEISIQYDRLGKLLQPVLNGMVAAKEVLDQATKPK